MRSKPLKLNKEGEPTVLLFVQQGKDPWRLIVTDPSGRSKGKTFSSYRKAKEVIAKMKEKHPDSEYTIVSRQVGYGPPQSKISDEDLVEMNSRGRYWCPFCRKFRIFELDPYHHTERLRCPICHMPESSWHVMRNNPRLVLKMYSV